MGYEIWTDIVSTYASAIRDATVSAGEMLDKLDNRATSISDSWQDLQGESYIANYSSFVADAREIFVQLQLLSDYAAKMAEGYDTTIEGFARKVVL